MENAVTTFHGLHTRYYKIHLWITQVFEPLFDGLCVGLLHGYHSETRLSEGLPFGANSDRLERVVNNQVN